MSVQHANRGIVKKDLQLYYNREFAKSFRGESSTNLITNTVTSTGPWDGNNFNNWINATVTENVDIAPDGTMTAVMLTGGYSRWTNSITVAASTTYTASIWLKNINLSTDPIIRIATGLNGTLVDYATNALSVSRSTITGWKRVSVSATIPASGVNQIQFGVTFSNSYPHSTSILVWGAQFEKKAYMTQYSNLATDYFSRNETITNLLTTTYSSLPTNWSIDASGYSGAGTYSYIENNSAIRIVDVNSNTRFRPTELYLSGFSASTDYTFSVKYRKVSGTPTLRFQIGWYNASNVLVGSWSFPTTPQVSIYNIDGWQLAKFTVTSPASTAKVTWFIQDGDDYTGYTHSYDLKEPQIQTGTYPTKWTSNTATANTLTSGGGLLDISGNNVNADLTNVLFNSSGYYFGGTNNYIQSANVFNLGGSDYTIDGWFYLDSSTSSDDIYRTIFCIQDSVTSNNWIELTKWRSGVYNNGLYYDYNKGAYTSYARVDTSSENAVAQWIHFACTRNGNTTQLFLNSVSKGTATITDTWSSNSYLLIGLTPYYAQYMKGQVPQLRIYSRSLTAAEVLQNFNATRKTYGI